MDGFSKKTSALSTDSDASDNSDAFGSGMSDSGVSDTGLSDIEATVEFADTRSDSPRLNDHKIDSIRRVSGELTKEPDGAKFDTARSTFFQAALQAAIEFVTTTFLSEIEQKQLYYHGLEHVQSVAKRADLIFGTVLPFLKADRNAQAGTDSAVIDWASDWERQRELLRLSAIAHDMIQLFVPSEAPHKPRVRESGRSEEVTFELLHRFMVQPFPSNDDGDGLGSETATTPFVEADIALVREAIAATVCQVDPADGAIYQPLLYTPTSISLAARCLALADIGTLGMEGIEAYQKEGSLLLLEENLDIADFVKGSVTFNAQQQEGLRQRLLKRARFQVSFAKSRLARLDTELQGLPEEAIASLQETVFKYLTPQTIATLVEITPTAEETVLKTLLDFFQLSVYT